VAKKQVIRVIVRLSILATLMVFISCKARENKVSNREPGEKETITEDEYTGADTTDSGKPGKGTKATGKVSSTIADYKYTWTDSKDIPPVLIIVDDFGYSGGSLLQDFAGLPSQVAFAVIPDLPNTVASGQIAAANGHDVLIHVPMEAKTSPTSPGTRYIKTGMPAEDITAMLSAFKSQLPMAIAANNHMGSTATADEDVMSAVLDHLNGMGMFFIDSATSANRLSYNLAKSRGYRSLRRDIFLDVPDSKDATIAAKIQSLGKYKGRTEPIVIITHCHNRTKLEALQQFIAQIQAMGVRLISLSEAKTMA